MFTKTWCVSVLWGIFILNTGCSLGFFASSVDSSYQPGLEAPGDFTKTWTVGSGTSGEFTMVGDALSYTANSAELIPIGSDYNNTAIGFGSGTKSDTDWNGTNALELNAAGKTAKTGTFISRVFAANSSLNWTKLEWISGVPAGKPYPNNKAIETAYDADNIDMSGNILLLHMDETSWSGAAGEVIDSSGNGNHGLATGVSTTTNGHFAHAGNFSAGSGQYIEIADTGNFNITTTLTVEAWVYPQFIAGDETKYFGIVTKRNDYTDFNFAISYMTFGLPYPTLNIDFRQEDESDTSRFNTGIALNNNEWAHIVMTFDQGVTGERLKVYVNGVLVTGTPGSGAGGTLHIKPGAFPLRVGMLDNTFTETFRGKIDEVAMYNRVLSESEVQARYRRGSNRLKFQVQTCATPAACNGTFLGPDGTAATYYTEAAQYDIAALTSINLTGVSGNNFRYKVTMENDEGTLTPLLKSVAVTPVTYSVAKPNIAAQNGVTYKKLTSFAAITSGAGVVKFQLVKEGSAYYWNGTSWASATTSSHTNTASEINAHIAAFPSFAGTGSLRFKAFFESDDGTAKSSLTSVTVGGAR
ncbi:hypothetical protein AZI86_03585 [Bdellovibrio bacteriovorus]|uniref:LamG-like jellyroll fold domain-containing protein n=1 Tax=Bdellovibrio bacteriovorus TaxID=959 RepID=A0A150WP71_BDEBC|nr:LamG domain-containing protein [Bdellovibrio bacteriovorus]KYG66156.1 hypothetical protein AZI86_03585 [Bdellovibrio bacteriovorus]